MIPFTVEIERRNDGSVRVLVQRSDRSTVFEVAGPPRIALSAFAAWLESEQAGELAGVHRSPWRLG